MLNSFSGSVCLTHCKRNNERTNTRSELNISNIQKITGTNAISNTKTILNFSLFLIPTFENYGDEPMVDPAIVSETNLHYLVSLISFRKLALKNELWGAEL
jgi:hypothetical protein